MYVLYSQVQQLFVFQILVSTPDCLGQTVCLKKDGTSFGAIGSRRPVEPLIFMYGPFLALEGSLSNNF